MKIALYGDSIGRGVVFDEARGRYVYLKQGFDKLLEEGGQVQIENHSRFGAIAEEGLSDFQKAAATDADVIAIEYGGNDCTPDWKAAAAAPDKAHQARVVLPDFEKTLTRFVGAVRNLKKIPLLITPPPLVTERFVPWITKGLDALKILEFLGDAHHVYRWQEQYALAIHKVGRLTRSRLFDLRTFFLAEKDMSSLYCIDGMHPNQLGHRLIAEAAAKMLPQLTAAPS